MATITYTVNLPLVLEMDDTHPTARRFLSLDEAGQAIVLSTSVRKTLIEQGITDLISKVNHNNSYLLLKLGE